MDSEQLSEVLSEFARTMVTDFAIQGILDHLVKRIVDVMPISAAGVTLISGSLDPRYVAASDGDALQFERLQTELREGPCLVAYLTGEPVLVPDLRTDDRFPKFAPRAVAAGLGAVFTFPLRHGDSQLGALDLYGAIPRSLPPDSMTAAQTLADVAAAYLLNAQARADLQSSSDLANEAALHDSLTGLPNRALMLERLKHASGRARRAGSISAVFFVDLDNFKAVNDTFGHQAGDQLLIAVARRLIGTLRPGDTVARMSGDEFVILCEDMSGKTQTDAVRARIDAALAVPLVVSGNSLTLTASIGVAFTDGGDDSPERVIHDADLAMYRLKPTSDSRRQALDLRARAAVVPLPLVAPPLVPADLVSPRELEVLLMIADGAANGEIAERLVIAETTVQSHVQHILRKLGARNRTEAVARYLRG
jgi:diguanylate cyclase (GGDEF)-like protein